MSDPLLSNDSSRSKTPTPQVGRTPAPTPASRESAALKTRARTQGFDEAERERIPSENKQPGQRPGKAPAKKNGAASPSAEGHASRGSEREAEAPDVQGPEIALEGMTLKGPDPEYQSAKLRASEGIGDLINAMMRVVNAYHDSFMTALLEFQAGMTLQEGPASPSFLDCLGTLAADGFEALLPKVGHPFVASILQKARVYFAPDASGKASAAQAARFSIAHSTRVRLEALNNVTNVANDVIAASKGQLVDDFLDEHFVTLEESLAELKKSTPMASSIVPPMSYFLDRLTAEWVTGPGATQGTTLSQLSKPRGRVVIHASVSEDHGRYSPQLEKVTLDVAVLGENAADLVKEAIGRRGLFGADIPVDLNVQVPNQVGGRGYRRVHMLSAGVPERVPFLPNGRPAFDAIMNDSGFWTQAATQAASNLQGRS